MLKKEALRCPLNGNKVAKISLENCKRGENGRSKFEYKFYNKYNFKYDVLSCSHMHLAGLYLPPNLTEKKEGTKPLLLFSLYLSFCYCTATNGHDSTYLDA